MSAMSLLPDVGGCKMEWNFYSVLQLSYPDLNKKKKVLNSSFTLILNLFKTALFMRKAIVNM